MGCVGHAFLRYCVRGALGAVVLAAFLIASTVYAQTPVPPTIDTALDAVLPAGVTVVGNNRSPDAAYYLIGYGFRGSWRGAIGASDAWVHSVPDYYTPDDYDWFPLSYSGTHNDKIFFMLNAAVAPASACSAMQSDDYCLRRSGVEFDTQSGYTLMLDAVADPEFGGYQDIELYVDTWYWIMRECSAGTYHIIERDNPSSATARFQNGWIAEQDIGAGVTDVYYRLTSSSGRGRLAVAFPMASSPAWEGGCNVTPTPTPSPAPSSTPTPVNSPTPAPWPTALPTATPIIWPTALPTATPFNPPVLPTATPIIWPTALPTATPIIWPTAPPFPTSAPTSTPLAEFVAGEPFPAMPTMPSGVGGVGSGELPAYDGSVPAGSVASLPPVTSLCITPNCWPTPAPAVAWPASDGGGLFDPFGTQSRSPSAAFGISLQQTSRQCPITLTSQTIRTPWGQWSIPTDDIQVCFVVYTINYPDTVIGDLLRVDAVLSILLSLTILQLLVAMFRRP